MIVDLSRKSLGVGKMSGDDNSLDGRDSVASVRSFLLQYIFYTICN